MTALLWVGGFVAYLLSVGVASRLVERIGFDEDEFEWLVSLFWPLFLLVISVFLPGVLVVKLGRGEFHLMKRVRNAARHLTPAARRERALGRARQHAAEAILELARVDEKAALQSGLVRALKRRPEGVPASQYCASQELDGCFLVPHLPGLDEVAAPNL